MSPVQPKNPLHGVTLERMLVELVARYGWPALGEQVDIRCFQVDPSVASSLNFLRRTPWARQRVESLYLFMLRDAARRSRAATGQPRGADEAAAGGRES
jgi:uncharacterized protein (DUF2132 family)